MNRIIPYIFATITQHNRQKIKIIWSGNSWVHNIFRVWELIFWRREGIRCEMSSGPGWQQPHTFEAACALLESTIRGFISHSIPRVYVISMPALATPQGVFFPSAYRFAIAFDAAAGTKSNAGVSSLTWSHTVTGSNTFLVINGGVNATSGRPLTTATYNSVSATQDQDQNPGAVESTLWHLVAPTTGANSAVINATDTITGGGSQFDANSISYTGAKQTGQPDSSNKASQNGTQTSFTVSTTVVASNCWLSGSATEDAGEIAGGSPGTGTIYRGVSQFNMFGADSNGTVSTGSQSLIWGRGATPGNGNQTGAILSIAPAAAAINSNFFVFMK